MLFLVEEIYDNYKSSFYVIINDNRQVNLAMKDVQLYCPDSTQFSHK